jgi:hypothetical protein
MDRVRAENEDISFAYGVFTAFVEPFGRASIKTIGLLSCVDANHRPHPVVMGRGDDAARPQDPLHREGRRREQRVCLTLRRTTSAASIDEPSTIAVATSSRTADEASPSSAAARQSATNISRSNAIRAPSRPTASRVTAS